MSELQKIAVAVREAAAWIDDRCGEPSEIGAELLHHAARLDALAAQEPCGWRLIRKRDGFVRGFQRSEPDAESLEFAKIDGDEYQPCYLAPPAQSVELEWLRNAVKLAYGHLWNVNEETAAPIPVRTNDEASIAARHALRDVLTMEERGQAINSVRALLARREESK